MEKKVEEAELNFLNATPQFEISPEFFNIESLKIVKLYFCVVDLPPLLKGSAFLKTLVLKKSVIVTPTFINTIFKHCMLLEYLDITQSRGLNELKILAENLKKFKVLKIGDCPNLVEIEIVSLTLRSFHYCGNLIGDQSLELLPAEGCVVQYLA
ncbi:hypothetical protein Dsin_027671 [Dipteronia sinensis]|uniref:At1g61320/AtMIF1 LRR domain-containing protein n=1 Tax=Dipteronia sinensis TaxID=43782 RepID=A0AAE0DTP6_9ROSI|nr:hypothetical protein Dsin_027671 [Dipteronia sinensis]